MLRTHLRSCLPLIPGKTIKSSTILPLDVLAPILNNINVPVLKSNVAINRFSYSSRKPDNDAEKQTEDEEKQDTKQQKELQQMKSQTDLKQFSKENMYDFFMQDDRWEGMFLKFFFETEAFKDKKQILLSDSKESVQMRFVEGAQYLPKMKEQWYQYRHLPYFLYNVGLLTGEIKRPRNLMIQQSIIFARIPNRERKEFCRFAFRMWALQYLQLQTLPINFEQKTQVIKQFQTALQRCMKQHPVGYSQSSAQTALFARWLVCLQKQHTLIQPFQINSTNHLFYPISQKSRTAIIHQYVFIKLHEKELIQDKKFVESVQKEYFLKGLKNILEYNVMELVMKKGLAIESITKFEKIALRPIVIIYSLEKSQVIAYSEQDRVYSVDEVKHIVQFMKKKQNLNALEKCAEVEAIDKLVSEAKKYKTE